MAIDFRILGPLEVMTESGPVRLGGRKQRGVLALLLLHANEVMPVERLADELYAGAPPATAGAQIRDHVSQLRKLLGPNAGTLLETRSPGYLLHVDSEQLDAARFERLLDTASSELAEGQDAQAAARMRQALLLWRGPALADLAYAPFAQPEIGRLEELRLTALERRIEADLRLGRNGALIGELEALVAQHPLREQFRAQLTPSPRSVIPTRACAPSARPTPTTSSAVSGSRRIWSRGSARSASSPSSGRAGAGSRRSCWRGSCPRCEQERFRARPAGGSW